jgi:hypothetical protein
MGVETDSGEMLLNMKQRGDLPDSRRKCFLSLFLDAFPNLDTLKSYPCEHCRDTSV